MDNISIQNYMLKVYDDTVFPSFDLIRQKNSGVSLRYILLFLWAVQ